MLESWASQYGLQEEALHYLKRLSTAADLLATPKVQLLQVRGLMMIKTIIPLPQKQLKAP